MGGGGGGVITKFDYLGVGHFYAFRVFLFLCIIFLIILGWLNFKYFWRVLEKPDYFGPVNSRCWAPSLRMKTMTMTMDLFQLRAHEGQKIIGEILHTMIEHN